MNVIATVLSILLAAGCTITALGDLRRDPRILEVMARLEVPSERLVVLAALKLAGAAGLLVGIAVQWLQVTAAALLMLYFIGAVASHARVRDRFAGIAPAFVMTVLATLVALASLSR